MEEKNPCAALGKFQEQYVQVWKVDAFKNVSGKKKKSIFFFPHKTFGGFITFATSGSGKSLTDSRIPAS